MKKRSDLFKEIIWLFIIGCIFIVGSIKLRGQNLNKYAIKKK